MRREKNGFPTDNFGNDKDEGIPSGSLAPAWSLNKNDYIECHSDPAERDSES
ncbi:hypothetical protein ACFL5L_05285 [candidate division KSB1 bacterium]